MGYRKLSAEIVVKIKEEAVHSIWGYMDTEVTCE